MKKIVIFILIALMTLHWYRQKPVVHGPGVVAPNPPLQNKLQNTPSFMHEGYAVQPLATFDVSARVLSRKNYTMGGGSDICPVDFALGWGSMSDEAVLNQINITQSNRWYRWYTKKFPIPRREIETNSANMHIIPSSESIAKQLKDVRKGHVVHIVGELVNIQSGSWSRKTSLTRNDTGAGSCEIIWVKEFSNITLEENLSDY